MATSDNEYSRSRSPTPDESGGEQTVDDMSELKTGQPKPQNGTSNAKDPSRPRRKKARRACFACQRAHLTCGDERPCQRCIKRGLQDACQDGVRKKAKYLHDAPNEALMPGVGATLYTHPQAKRTNSSQNESPQQRQPSQSQQFFPPSQQPFNLFPQSAQMPPPMLQDQRLSTTSFPQQSPLTPSFSISTQHPLHSPPVGQDHGNPAITTSPWNGLTGTLFEDPSLMNFDTSNLNFANNYGALEFGMLGQMATNAGDTPPSDTATTRGSVHQPYRVPLGSFSESPSNSFPYNDALMSDWSNGSVYNMQPPHAFAIETNAQFHSPENHPTPPDGVKFEESPLLNPTALKPSLDLARHLQQTSNVLPPKQRQPTHISTPQLKARSQLPVKPLKKTRDPSAIYTSVITPHPYTTNFHALIAYLQKRFASQPSKTLAIAKSLASIRPSFIATTKTLNRDDLIFMEKCFQRTLFEYEGFIEGVGTPTIVARRTGEIAAVGKEFQILTGWTKNILLGRAPNLNVNRGHSGLTPQTGSGANTGGKLTGTGWNTPTQQRHAPTDGVDGKGDRPVFLAELLDDDSVVQFYEDFARLAFGDSRGSVFRKGKLLKYRTKDDEIVRGLREADSRNEDSKEHSRTGSDGQIRSPHQDRNPAQRDDKGRNSRDNILTRKDGISGEKGMQKLGSADGKVDCAYCWTVKRDVFDIPMLIVMNVSVSLFYSLRLYIVRMDGGSVATDASKGHTPRNAEDAKTAGVVPLEMCF